MSLLTVHEGIVNSDASTYVVVIGNGGGHEPLGSMRASLLVWYPPVAEVEPDFSVSWIPGFRACWKEGGTWVSG